MSIPQSEIDQSQDWWRSLSLNEWKALEAKYSVISVLCGLTHIVHEIWLKEGKPCS